MLTALDAEDDRVKGLELGADDYLTKPFGHRELIARVSAMLRRVPRAPPERVIPQPVQLGSVVLDPTTHEVTRAGQHVALTPTEFRLLKTLMQRPNVVVPTRTLLKEVWGHEDLTARNVLRVTAGRLRAKLERDPAHPRMLLTVPGEGLIIRSDQPPAPASQALPEAPIHMEYRLELKELLDEMGVQTLRTAQRSLHQYGRDASVGDAHRTSPTAMPPRSPAPPTASAATPPASARSG